MRTFLALDLPENVRRNISALIEQLKGSNVSGIKWVTFENLHITFQFIGDTQRHDISEIGLFLENIFCDFDKINFLEPKLEIIPARNPRIIWISLQTDHKEILKASRQFKNKLHDMGYKLDKKPIRFHITLGRIKKRLPDFFVQQILTPELKITDFEVSEVTLYESFLRPQGPVYEKVLNYHF
jgi:RNA 2',3'-cyclic 3'-phosphodiesterase